MQLFCPVPDICHPAGFIENRQYRKSRDMSSGVETHLWIHSLHLKKIRVELIMILCSNQATILHINGKTGMSLHEENYGLP